MSTYAVAQKSIAPRVGAASMYHSRNGTLLQRKCACAGSSHGHCDECRKKLQRSAVASAPAVAPPMVHRVLATGGRPLDTLSRSFYEPIFSHDFSHVRVHTDEEAARSARSVGALAYTVGHHIVFDSGRYEPSTEIGHQLLAHELAHVVQQSEAAEGHVGLSVGPPDDGCEQQADRIAASIPYSQGTADHAQSTRRGAHHVVRDGVPVLRRKVPTGISLAGVKSFGHADLVDEADKEKYLTNIGAVSLLKLTPPGDYTEEKKKGDCTKEFLTEVLNTCPPSPRPFCRGSVCFQVNGNANTGDPKTGNTFSEGTDSFVDRHIARYDTSFLSGSGKRQCSVVCHQTYKYRTEADHKYHELGSFYIIRNFRASTYTPKGKHAIDITTGNIQKIPAPANAPSRDDFLKKEAPALVRGGTLLDVPTASPTRSAQ